MGQTDEYCVMFWCRLLVEYQKEERLSKEAFYQSCMQNPTIKDRLPILNRILDLNKKVTPHHTSFQNGYTTE